MLEYKYYVYWSNIMKSKVLTITIIIAIIAILSATWYFLWYIPHTPVYTFQTIREAVENKDADTVLEHIDTTSLVKNIVTREGNTYVDTSSPLGKAAVAATKTFGPALLDDVIRKYVENPDSFKSANDTNNENEEQDTSNTFSMIDRIQRGELFKQRHLEIKNITSEDDGNTATVTVTIHNTKTNQTTPIRVLMKHIGDGTWAIYDIPNIEALYKITRK
mgnify:FL=1